MPRIRNYAPSLKAKVAIEAIKGSNTTAQIAQTFSVPPNLVTNWKKQRWSGCRRSSPPDKPSNRAGDGRDELHQQIGRLKVELDFLKKKFGLAR